MLIKLLKTSDRKNKPDGKMIHHVHGNKGKNDNKLLIGNNASHKGEEYYL